MKCFKSVILLLLTLTVAYAAEIKFKNEIRALSKQIEKLKQMHVTEVNRLRSEIEELKLNMSPNEVAVDQYQLQQLRDELIEARANNSHVSEEVDVVRSELQRALDDAATLSNEARAHIGRYKAQGAEIDRLKYEAQQMRHAHNELKAHVAKITKEIKTKEMETLESLNEVEDPWESHAHRLRHSKNVANHVNKLAHEQEMLNERHNELQTLVFDVMKRLDTYRQPNWELITAKIEMLELETKVLRNEVKNITQKISDFDKLHASMLELREDLESNENKADKIIPEFRQEISKLDINIAQLTAQCSYLKEGQENLRQSVKAIAVSVSNAIDHAEADRVAIRQINDSMNELYLRGREHHNRLNDHILKSEMNHDSNEIEEISLPELMGEVKELQPVESEYQDLVNQLPRDCSNVTGPPGAYLIRPTHAPKDAWCNNGSTLLQRRYNGSVEFNRKFSEYVHGFGDPTSEYWLGLEAMHRITRDNCSSMRIDMTDIYGGGWYAQYEHFHVGDAGTGYKLDVSGFKGNASDAFEYQNHMEFSAIDHDRDISNTHCAGNYEGGWWFSHCQHVNINGRYTLGLTWFDAARNQWIAVASSEMSVYRQPSCQDHSN